MWAKEANKFTGAKRKPAPRLQVNRVTGKRTANARYAPATINHTLSVVHEFYEFFREKGEGPLRNPVPTVGGLIGTAIRPIQSPRGVAPRCGRRSRSGSLALSQIGFTVCFAT